jgi:ketosteroid isomerase-like protein
MDTAELSISEEGKLQLATTFLTALKSRDWELMRTVLTSDVNWTLPGTSLLSGEAKGVDAVIDRACKLRDFGVLVELLHILYSMKGVAVSLHNTAQRGDLILDEYVVIVMELQGEKIARLTTHLNDIAGINRFFTAKIIDNQHGN